MRPTHIQARPEGSLENSSAPGITQSQVRASRFGVVDLSPTILQGAIAIPITSGLVLYTLLRNDRSPLQVLVAATLAVAVVWMSALVAGTLVPIASPARARSFGIEIFAIAAVTPLFLVTMGRFARIPLFEYSRAAWISLGAVSGLFYLAYLTDSQHHLFLSDRAAALANEHPRHWGGPAFWALQIWCYICSVWAIGIVVRAAWQGRTPSERKRSLIVLGAVFTPVVTHAAYLLQWPPLDYSLAIGSMAPSAFFLIKGVSRYGMLSEQPIVRQDVIDHFPDGIILADADGLVLDTNDAARVALGALPGSLRGQTLADALAPLDAPGRDSPIGERIAALPLSGGGFHEEIRTGMGRTIELMAGAVAARGSEPAGRFIALSDRTEQRRSERLLQERQKLESVGILAAGVAHEVNNPLAFVRANLAHLQRVTSDVEKELGICTGEAGSDLLEVPIVLAESLEGLDRISHIVNGMLQFARMSEEGLDRVSPNRLLEDALRLAALHRETEIGVEQHLADELPDVTGSPQRLVQVILNLLLNAKQALVEQGDGRIWAETGSSGEWVEIRIRDNGPGISETDRDQIFDPFFTTRPPGKGTGLGLSIASDIIREHGGSLECDSMPGRGTTFTIRLPRSLPRDLPDLRDRSGRPGHR